ncbi:hypothetical protein [Bacillus pumilus]|uniref:hypothetical protein n=1 Tax=Bacillus pumilus TaxID=1408 RepID=UPI000B450D5D|nr:hypothetical protein [Bacillus pumilus]OUZ06698.1 hypothetical protein BHE94_15625 [Bacillus pumilus]
MKSKKRLFKNVILLAATTLIISGFSGINSASADEQKLPKKQSVEAKTDFSSQMQLLKISNQMGQVHAMGNIDSSQYAARVTLNLSQIRKMTSAQRNIFDKGFKKKDYSKLKDALGGSATVLGLIFVTSTPAGVVAGVSGLLATLAPSAHGTLKQLVHDGYWEMGYLEDFLTKNKRYDLIDVQLPFIEYKVKGKRIRFVTGKGVVKRVHSKTGWITL